jgi:tripeptide aminopeptidase
VEIKAECRSQTHDKCISQSEIIKRVFETAAAAIGAKADVRMELAYKAVKIPEDAEVVAVAKRAVESIGLTPQVRVICGGTDASIYNEKGVQMVIVGTGARSEHSKEEHIYVEDMEKAVRMIHHIFQELSG